MKRPQTPPNIFDTQKHPNLLERAIGLWITYKATDMKYRHWETIRRQAPPSGFTVTEYWASFKLQRLLSKKEVPLKAIYGYQPHYTLPDALLQMLHEVDKNAAGSIIAPSESFHKNHQQQYIFNSLMEEAITSSQLEGAATTRSVAKKMIENNRQPINKDEQMIFNNFKAMQFIVAHKHLPLNSQLITELHQILIQDTQIQEESYFRQPNDGIGIYDERQQQVFTPPDASEIPDRLTAFCDFANNTMPNAFLHPVVKSIIIHYWFAYDHPFVDGNGRTARALFYWSLMNSGFWLSEYISISSILKKSPARYAKSYLYVQTDDNDLTYFILFQLKVFLQAIDEVYLYVAKKSKETKQAINLLQNLQLNYRQQSIVYHALTHEYQSYTIETHKNNQNITYQTARTDLLDLVDKGFFVKKMQSRKAFLFFPAQNLSDKITP